MEVLIEFETHFDLVKVHGTVKMWDNVLPCYSQCPIRYERINLHWNRNRH